MKSRIPACKLIVLALLLLSVVVVQAQRKYSATSKYSSYKGLLMCGYQGWFNAPGDSAGRGWNHYVAKGALADGNCKIDLWPDTREYKVTYASPFLLPNGKEARLFSSYDATTTDLHFRWMQQYDIDGVFIQRFVSNLKSAKSLHHNNVVLQHAMAASKKYDRAIGVMYDLSGMKAGDASVIINDWKYLVDEMKMACGGDKQTYLYHRNKPLVTLWGVGFNDGRAYGLNDVSVVVDFLKNDPVYGGCSIMLGVPTQWRELKGDTGADSNLLQLVRQTDIVQPWFVGRFNERNIGSMKGRIEEDLAWCRTAGVDYVPVVYPGFSWHNMYNNSPQNQIPRNKGQFFWTQLTNAIEAGVPMIYVAMFDEIDEGTAIFKISKNPPEGKSRFVTFEEGIPEDHYLQLAGKAAKMLKRPPGNPFITSIYTADPSAHVWADGRLYVYPSHDIDPARGCDLMDRYHVYSTDDMVNWRDEGEILNAAQVAWGRKEGGFMWAPDCAYKNGTYYFYFPHPSGTSWDTTWKVGIATSKKPASDFTSAGYIEGLRGRSMIDPCVFVDDDGKAYLYWGGGSRCESGRLKDNMSELDGPMQQVTGLVDFHEATWVFKRNGIYYLTYADNNPKQNQLRYATGSSPLGPWTYRGVFLGATGCDTNHGSVVEYKGQWYIFYHNQSISNTGKGNLRSICVDLVNFNDDGSIQLVKQTKTGPPALKSVIKTKAAHKYEAEKSTIGGGATTAKSTHSNGSYVTGLEGANTFIEFNKVKGEAKDGRVTIRIYHANTSYAKIKLIVNGTDYSYLNALPTSGEDSFTGVISFTVKLNKGANNTIKLIGGNGKLNIDYITTTPLD